MLIKIEFHIFNKLNCFFYTFLTRLTIAEVTEL
jgi:hypothetical protein